MKNIKSGFTLIELMLVMLIIGVLSAIAIPSFANAKIRAMDAKYTTATRILNGEADFQLGNGVDSITPTECAYNVDLKGLVPDGSSALSEIDTDWTVSECFSEYQGL